MSRLPVIARVIILAVSLLPIPHRLYAVEILTQQVVFRPGENGYDIYRIPTLVVAADGSVLAFIEARKNGVADEGDIDLVMKRSTDHGNTWSAMKILADAGEVGAQNPCAVVDQSTGTVWLPYIIYAEKKVLMMHSTDHGKSWSAPVEITAQLKSRESDKFATGPTHGIQLSSGRLVIPSYNKIGEDNYSCIIYSDDHGQSWNLGGTVDRSSNECGVVELVDGRMLLNMRKKDNEFDEKERAIAYSNDGGISWGPVSTEPQLIGPICEGSILRLSTEKDGKRNRILFSNPHSRTKRENVTVKLSYDECKTWPIAKRLFTGKSVYSDLAFAADGMILCLYERGLEDYYDEIKLARFNLEWLTDGADSLP
jgi:sialidase-1